MNRLIRTPGGSLIQVVAQIDIHLLPRAHIPRRLIRPVDARMAPLQIVAAPGELAVCVLGLGEGHGERVVVDGARFRDDGVEVLGWFAGARDELDELAVDDLELAGGGVVA